MFLSFRRIIKTGFVNFWRNGFVSVSSVVVMTITLFVIGSLIFLNAMLQSSLTLLKDKVDINAYFVADASEDQILAVQSTLKTLPEVRDVVYTSRDQALANFKQRHSDDQIELQALDELGDNPLLASLSIKANDPSNYESISNFLQSDQSTLSTDGQSILAKVNFNNNKDAIDKLTELINGIEKFGMAVSLVLIIVSIVIVFNTIRLAIFIAREEISVMRLVGASDAYIRGPFVFEGVMYGLIAALITLVAFYPLGLWLGPATQQFFGNINLFTYYTAHFGPIFLTLVGAGMFLGALSSFLAVKKYLRV
jgi:cell division transport system permease protein